MITQHKKTSILWTMTAIMLCLFILAGCCGIVGPESTSGNTDIIPSSAPETDDSSTVISPSDNPDKESNESDEPAETDTREAETEDNQPDNSGGTDNRYYTAGIDDPSDFEEFFRYLQEQVASDSQDIVAEYIAYPVNVMINGSKTAITTKSEFVENYDSIFTEEVKSAFLNQKVKEIVVSYQGIMVDQGKLWFNKLKDTKHKYSIYAISN